MFIGQAETFTVKSLNHVALSNASVAIFNCSTYTTDVYWLFYRYEVTGPPCYVYKSSGIEDEHRYCRDTSRFNVTPSSSNNTGNVITSFNLVISNPQFSDAGTYVCVESGKQKAAALLGVIGTNCNCNYNHHRRRHLL